MRPALLLSALLALAAACRTELVCPSGQTNCGGRCVTVPPGATCDRCASGTCAPDALVACYWTNEVVPVTSALAPVGPSLATDGAGPQAVAVSGGTAYTVTGMPAARLVGAPVGATAPAFVTDLPDAPNWADLSAVAVHGGLLFVANAVVGTIEVLDPAGGILDEVPLPHQTSAPNPRSIAFAGSHAYVVLSQPPDIQSVARIDLSGATTCAAPDPAAPACGDGLPACAADRRCVAGACRVRCGDVDGEIDLGVAGATDGAALPSPDGVAAIGSRVLVPLANVESATTTCDGFTFTWWLKPAGNGRLAVIDTANGDALSIVDLGPGCKAPADVAVDGTRAWISCGSMCFSDLAPGAIVPVDFSGEAPAVGAATTIDPVIGGAIAVCGGKGYVADVRKTGLVVPFDAATGAAGAGVAVCGFDAYQDSLASGIACSE